MNLSFNLSLHFRVHYVISGVAMFLDTWSTKLFINSSSVSPVPLKSQSTPTSLQDTDNIEEKILFKFQTKGEVKAD